MRYATARHEQSQRELAYRIYVTDSFHFISQGKGLGERFYNFLYPAEVVDENKPADEVARDILKRAGLEVKTEDG